jgi:hypothetical protein
MSTVIPSAAPSESDFNVVLIRRVAEALMGHDPDAFARLDVTAIGATVALRGTLVGEAARDLALVVARSTSGVACVIDGIVVRARPAAPPSTDVVTLTSAPVRAAWWERAVVPAALLAILAAIGAHTWSAAAAPSKPEPQAVVPVEGVALVDGKPAAGAKLTFHPLYAVGGMAERPTAIVGPDGRFSVGTYAEADGAPVGPYVVTMEHRPQTEAGESPPPPTEQVPPVFRSRFTSPLKAQIPNDATFVRLPPFHVAAARKTGKG